MCGLSCEAVGSVGLLRQPTSTAIEQHLTLNFRFATVNPARVRARAAYDVQRTPDATYLPLRWETTRDVLRFSPLYGIV